jgi:acetolactate synthase small subunit
MSDTFEQIRHQIHDLRNLIGPVNLKLADMEHQIITCRDYIEEKTGTLESKLLSALFRLDRQDIKIAEMSERMSRLERQNGT